MVAREILRDLSREAEDGFPYGVLHTRQEQIGADTLRDLPAAVAAVEKLTEAGWQDDTRFAENLVRMRANTGYGPIHIRAELGTHGLDSEQIAAAMDTFEGDWTENARDLVCRRFGEGGPQELPQRRKAADLLARRGFDGDSIRRATRYDPED